MSVQLKWRGVILAIVVLASPPAFASNGFHLGAGVGFVVPMMSGEVASVLDPALGLHLDLLNLGYGFSDKVYAGLYLGGGGGGAVSNSDWATGYLGIMGKYIFSPDKPFSPYAELGVHSADFVLNAAGGSIFSDAVLGFMLGGGIDFYRGAKKNIILSADLSYRTADISSGVSETAGEKINFNGLDLNANVVVLMFKAAYAWTR